MSLPDEDPSRTLARQSQSDDGNGSTGLPIPAELIDALPPPFQEAIRQAGDDPRAIAIITSAFSAYRGPLPPSTEMRAYEEILPGSADRILKMAEGQAHHRQEMEKTAVDGGSRRSWWGLWLGFGISIIVIGASVLLVLKGHDAAGITLAGIDLVALAAVFVVGRSGQRKERVQKDAASHALPPSLPADSN